jgi:type II pantothenate kinase
MHVGIDFGTTNTDAVCLTESFRGIVERRWTLSNMPIPDENSIYEVLRANGIRYDDVSSIAITGGNRSHIPQTLSAASLPLLTKTQRPVVHIGEMDAIGRGGLALAGYTHPSDEAVIVSAGSGTAVVKASSEGISHITGIGIGGGTLIGLSRLLLDTANPTEIDQMALEGNANAVNLTIGDIIGGSLGRLPADATAVNFGRVARYGTQPSVRKEDIAAALVELVAQAIAVVGTNAARIQNMERIIITGHLSDMHSIRRVFERVASFSGISIEVPEHGGYAVALGALLAAQTLSH